MAIDRLEKRFRDDQVRDARRVRTWHVRYLVARLFDVHCGYAQRHQPPGCADRGGPRSVPGAVATGSPAMASATPSDTVPRASLSPSPASSPTSTTTRIETEQRTFPAGSYIIRMDQPYSRIADALLDYQYW